jgi:hypothetical protein
MSDSVKKTKTETDLNSNYFPFRTDARASQDNQRTNGQTNRPTDKHRNIQIDKQTNGEKGGQAYLFDFVHIQIQRRKTQIILENVEYNKCKCFLNFWKKHESL